MNSSDLTKDFGILSKLEKYAYVKSALIGLYDGENDAVANMANTAAVIMEVFRWHWVGFYIVRENELVLGPFQGPVACTRIAYGKGVCGKCWEMQKAIVVPNVDEFAGHIACSALSKSEIVLPVFKNEGVALVLDIDSTQLNSFDESDLQGLTEICELISKWI